MSEHKFEGFKPEDFNCNCELRQSENHDWECCEAKDAAEIANAKIAPLLARLNELQNMLENARGALEFYTWSCNVLVGVGKDGKKDLFELKQIIPGVVWHTDIPTQESMPVPFGTVARKCLVMIEEIK
jgi:hypothetical protein